MKDLLIKYFPEALALTEKICRSMNLPFYLIGANATSILLMKAGYKPARGTKDIDLAVVAANHDQYEHIRNAFVSNGFRLAIEPFTLYHDGWNIAIDLMPFGGIESEGRVRFSGRETELVVLGYSEALAEPEQFEFQGLTIRTPSLAGMVMLKLLAYADRPENRLADLDDILLILNRYVDCSHALIFDTYPEELAEKDDQDYSLKVAARVVGLELARMSANNPSLRERLRYVLGNEPAAVEHPIAQYWVRRSVLPETALGILERLKTHL